ncbi:MAG: PLP-dependent aminotransferase family protein [Cytophagales bacterium]
MDNRFENRYSKRAQNVPPSFIREILKVTTSPDVISFAGGLPNSSFFPVEEFKEASVRVLEKYSSKALQYATTEGDVQLRKYLVNYYKTQHQIDISIDEILITSGSQQALDLISKLFIDEGDGLMLESPSYLGAIQCFSQYKPHWIPVEIMNDGPDMEALELMVNLHKPKLMYAIPNFQNPSGTCYSEAKREKLAKILATNHTLLIEDDPYGALDFENSYKTPLKKLYPKGAMHLGSFSKIVAPALRLGWVVAEPEIIAKLAILKQASDLHSNYFSQLMLLEYLTHNDLLEHIQKLRKFYHSQAQVMYTGLHKYFPTTVKFDMPRGGMFFWLDFPEFVDVNKLLQNCIAEENVVFVPGKPFYINGQNGSQKARFNFSNGNPDKIELGLIKIANQLNKF